MIQLIRQFRVRGTRFVGQRMAENGTVWIRLTDADRLLWFWSADLARVGTMTPDEVERVVSWAATSRNPRVVIDQLRFPGWQMWPGRPAALQPYLDQEFEDQARHVEMELEADSV